MGIIKNFTRRVRSYMFADESSQVRFARPSGRPSTLFGEMATRDAAENMIGFLGLLPNPDPVLKKIGKDIETYRELLTDPHLGSLVDTRKDNVRELEWSIKQGDSDTRVTRAVQEVFKGLDVNQGITEILDAPLFGYQPMELIWSPRNEMVWLEGITAKPPEWFSYNKRNEPRFLDRQSPSIEGVPLPPYKFVIPTHDPRYTNPYGFPVLSRCFWTTTFAKGGLKMFVTFAERYGMPWFKWSYPDEWEQDKLDDIMGRVEEMVQDVMFALPASAQGEVVPNGQRSSAEIYDLLITYCEKSNSKAVLGHAAAADTTPGRLGNEEGAMNAKWGRAASDKLLVVTTYNTAIRSFVDLNFGVQVPAPVFAFFEEEDVKLKAADRDSKLFTIGWRPTEQYLKRQYNMQEGDFTIAPPAPAGGGFFSEAAPRDSDPQTIIDNQADKARANDSVLKGVIDPILELIHSASDYDSVLTQLSKIYPDLSSTALEEKLTQVLFMSDVVGRLSVQKETGDA